MYDVYQRVWFLKETNVNDSTSTILKSKTLTILNAMKIVVTIRLNWHCRIKECLCICCLHHQKFKQISAQKIHKKLGKLVKIYLSHTHTHSISTKLYTFQFHYEVHLQFLSPYNLNEFLIYVSLFSSQKIMIMLCSDRTSKLFYIYY